METHFKYFTDVSGADIIAKIRERHPDHHHPRLILDDERIAFWREQAGKDNIFGKVYARQKYEADKMFDIPSPPYAIPDGIRILCDKRWIATYTPPLCGFYYRVTGDKKYARRAIDEMLNLASYPDWNPYHFLDVGDISTGVALGYDWCYDAMTDEERAKIRHAIVNFAFMPILDDYHDLPRRRTYQWYYDTPGDNWKFICNGGVSLAAMAICDEGGSGCCEEILDKAFKSNYDFLRNAYDEHDGSYVEGLSYWAYALFFLTQYSDGLVSACGTNFGLTDWVGIRKTGVFPKRLSSNTFSSFNFGDATEENPCTFAYLWLAHELNQPELATMRIRRLEENINDCVLRDILFMRDEPTPAPAPLPLDFVSLGATNATFRDSWDAETGIYAGIHFGNNNAPHAHNDTGTFVVEYAGKRFFSDLGRDDYNIRSYRDTYRFRAEGHNTLVFNPSDKPDQIRFAECYVERCAEGDVAFALSDMSPVYGENYRAARGLKMIKKSKTVVVRDEISCAKSDTVLWFGHTKAEIDLQNGGKEALLTIDGVKLRAVILDEGSFAIMEAKPMPTSPTVDRPQAENVGFRKLAIRLSGAEKHTVTVAFMPDGTKELPKNEPLAAW